MLKALGKELPPAGVKAAIRRVDDDDSGTLRYRECVPQLFYFVINGVALNSNDIEVNFGMFVYASVCSTVFILFFLTLLASGLLIYFFVYSPSFF